MGLRQRFLDWYLGSIRGRVEDWHAGQLALYWLVAVFAGFVAVFLMFAIGRGSIDVAEFLFGWVLMSIAFCLAGPIPATWVWLSVQQEGGETET